MQMTSNDKNVTLMITAIQRMIARSLKLKIKMAKLQWQEIRRQKTGRLKGGYQKTRP